MEETYTMTTICNNCGEQAQAKIPKGETISGYACRNCGCQTLTAVIKTNDIIF